jgi:hypothetical protein
MNFVRKNRNNFIVFGAPESSITLASLVDENVKFVDAANAIVVTKQQDNRVDTYSLPLFAGHQLYYYFNSTNLSTAGDFANWRIALVRSDNLALQYDNIATLTKDTITGISFRWYFDWTVPALNEGCYRFVVYENSGQTVLCLSENSFQYVADTDDLCVMRYRNPVNIQNFNYEGLTSRYNQFRLWLKKRRPQRSIESVGYDFTEGTFNRVRSVVIKSYEFVTDMMDEVTTDAFNTAIIHKTLEIDTGEGWQAFRLSEDAEIEQEFTENYELADATVRLQLIEYASSNKST